MIREIKRETERERKREDTEKSCSINVIVIDFVSYYIDLYIFTRVGVGSHLISSYLRQHLIGVGEVLLKLKIDELQDM